MSTTNDPGSTPPPDLPAALQPVLDRLVGLAAGALLRPFLDRLASSITNDAALRAQLRELARTLLTLTEEPRPVIAPTVATMMSAEPALTQPQQQTTPETVTLPQPTSNSISTSTPTPVPVVSAAPAVKPVTTPQPIYIPRRADYVDEEPTAERHDPVRHDSAGFGFGTSWHAHPPTDEDLPIVVQRCRLKAEATRWSATRQVKIDNGADFLSEIEPRDRDLFDRARGLPDCFLWMNHRKGTAPSPSAFNHLASCFEVAGAAAEMLSRVVQSPNPEEHLERALYLAAEAQSALRIAVADFGNYTDPDQLRIFIWVRETAARQRIWISRYMRQDDVAEPTVAASLLARIQELSRGIQTFQDRDKKRKKAQGKLRYHLKRIKDQPGPDRMEDWQTVVATVSELVQDGLPPSNPDLRDQLRPVLDDLPESIEVPKPFQLVMREIDRYLAVTAANTETADIAEAPSADVLRAAELLRGRALVLIGGVRRPEAADAIKEAFGLSELHWVEGREHSSYYAFEPDVANPDVVAVLLAIRWSSHGFGEVKNFCDKYDKPLVRLPGGYNPNQVAYHILTQIGGKLLARTEQQVER
jgi:hypothetical protein